MATALVERVRAFDPGLDGVSEVLHATFTDHVYPLHSHGTWTVLIVDEGVVRYHIDRDDRGADTRGVTILPPYVAHDGGSAHPGRGFRKRVLYLDVDAIGDDLVGRAVDKSTLDDARLRAEIGRIHQRFDHPRDDLEWETRLDGIIGCIQRRLTAQQKLERLPESTTAETLRDYLDGRLFQRLTLDEVATHLGWSKTHLIRSFTAEFGIPPHRYVISRRVEEARRRLLAGQLVAQVAIEVGFYDQAHLTRHFRAHYVATPGRFQQSLG